MRVEIAALEKITGVEEALADKRAELLAIQVAKRESKPFDSRARDIEKVVEGKKKAVAATRRRPQGQSGAAPGRARRG